MVKKFSSRIEEIATNCLMQLNVKITRDNLKVIEMAFMGYRGGRPYKPVVSFDENGNQINIFKSVSECAAIEGVPFKTMSNAICKKCVVRKTGLRYCFLSDFGKLTQI
mgnify:CR=1 FL=1